MISSDDILADQAAGSAARAMLTRLRLREIFLTVVAGVALIIGALLSEQVDMMFASSIAGTLCVLAVWLILLRRWQPLRRAWIDTHLSGLVEGDPAPCIGTDPAGRILYANPAARRRFGVGQGMLPGALVSLFADPVSVVQRMQSRAIAAGAAREDIVTRRGHLRMTVHRFDPKGFLWRLDDLGDVRGEEGSPLPRLILSKSGAVLGMNAAIRGLVGDRLRALDQIVTDLPLRPGEEHEIVTQEGTLRCFVAEAETPGNRREVYFLPVAEDKARSHDPMAFEALPIPLMRLSAEGVTLEVNRAARVLLGDVPRGTRLPDLFEGLGRPVGDWVADARIGRTDRRPEVLRLRGKEVFLQVSLNRMVEQGRMGLIAILTDATQFKTLEAQFVQSQKMQAIGQLAGGVAHDFNNLLTAISGHCDLLKLRHDASDPDFADLEQIYQNANRAAALVRQLLAFSRKQTMNPQVLDLRDVLSDLTHLLNRLVGEKVRLMLVHAPDLLPIRADKRQLEQVIMNLVVNARDAMPGGGAIRIDTRNLLLEQDWLRDRATIPRGAYVEVAVSDQGTGIAPDLLSKIFEPFFTTKRTGEGTGLGLSTAYGIVKQTGGYIFCESEQGEGTRFTIILPAYDRIAAEPEPVAPTYPAVPAATLAATVLLVEDEAAVRAFASRALKLRGFTVLEAENGEEALQILEDTGQAVDIFLSDVIMPGMDGPTWVAQALRARPGTAVLFMSGYAEDAFRDGLPSIANSRFLPKPFSLSDLATAVQETLGY